MLRNTDWWNTLAAVQDNVLLQMCLIAILLSIVWKIVKKKIIHANLADGEVQTLTIFEKLKTLKYDYKKLKV